VAKIYEKSKDFPNAARYYELNLVNKEAPTQVDYFKIGRLYYLAGSNKLIGDSIQRIAYIDLASKNFLKVTEMSPTNHLGWFWEARTQALKDPETETGIAKPFYEKALVIMDQTPEKFKREITEALKYMGYYHYIHFEQASIKSKKDEIAVYKDSSMLFWNRVVAIDPADKQAADAIKALTAQPQKKK
jgi:tetratricopeptide (TPR) repeat protein